MHLRSMMFAFRLQITKILSNDTFSGGMERDSKGSSIGENIFYLNFDIFYIILMKNCQNVLKFPFSCVHEPDL